MIEAFLTGVVVTALLGVVYMLYRRRIVSKGLMVTSSLLGCGLGGVVGTLLSAPEQGGAVVVLALVFGLIGGAVFAAVLVGVRY